ncbi:RhoGAP-domain-containing protein [Polyplosphaeria fusca]|uniref:RhoGAP-domain-containing protein n=1 Tax=Polyplosphaeria fusca TaxID=682080 RepID=A0A9P4QYV4_9PLEO|nr:RhoGAP-domain-containing protein [Polyplosphaeria fusca]
MPTGSHPPISTPRPRHGEPQPAPHPASEPATAKRDLTSWWKQFSKKSTVKKEEDKEPEVRGIFGVPLITSIPYANVAISLFNETGESYIYGYVPIVVAKCGVFLKEKATDVEGIFRLAGSEKRIKELKIAFDAPPRYGKGLDWTGYTVHDAANILRRYFNQLPEPIIPLQHYDDFRQPLRNHQAEAVGQIEGQAPSIGGFDPDSAVMIYQHLIKELPSLNRQLLLYILDLLAVFAAKSDVNKMTTSNLAAIFQPGILSHPQHDMSPQEYRLSQDVLIFLIDNQDHFLIGMEGTAVDAGTVKHIESGPSTPQARTPTTPGRNKSGLGRSASAASSAAAESIRKFGGIRRNVSTSSRHSRHSGAVPSPTTPSFATSSGTGVHRSNTLPSKRSPALQANRFPNQKVSDPPTPATEENKLPAPVIDPQEAGTDSPPPAQPVQDTIDVVRPSNKLVTTAEITKTTTPAPAPLPIPAPLESPVVTAPSPSEEVTPTGPAPSGSIAQVLSPPPAQRSPLLTPSREKSEFTEGPIDTGPGVDPSPAVRTFTQILSKVSPTSEEKKDGRKPNKLQKKQRIPSSSNPSAHSSTHSLTGNVAFDAPPSPLPPPHFAGASNQVQHAYNSDTVSSRNSGVTLKPSMSPSASFRSHSTATEYSEADPTEEAPHKEEKRSFWKSHKRGESRATPTASQTDLGSVPGAEKSMSSFGSSSGHGRRSLQYDSHPGSEASMPYGNEAKEHEKKSPFDWFQKKRQEHKDKKERAKSPPGSTHDLVASNHLPRPQEALAVRGRSMDVPRTAASEGSKGSSDVTPTATSPQPLPMTSTKAPHAQNSSGLPPGQPSQTMPQTSSSQPAKAGPQAESQGPDQNMEAAQQSRPGQATLLAPAEGLVEDPTEASTAAPAPGQQACSFPFPTIYHLRFPTAHAPTQIDSTTMPSFARLALLLLPLVAGVACEQAKPSPTKDVRPAYTDHNQAFQDLLNALPEESLHVALESLAHFQDGVFESHRRGVEAVHNRNPPLATKLIVEAVRDLKRRQAPAPSNGTTTPSQTSNPPPPPQSTQGGDDSSAAPPAPASSSQDSAVIVPVPITTTDSNGQQTVASSAILSEPTASVAVPVTLTNDDGSTFVSTATKPAVIFTATNDDGQPSVVTSAVDFAPTAGQVLTETDANGSTFVTTYTPGDGKVSSILLITTTGADGQPSVITSYTFVNPTGMQTGADGNPVTTTQTGRPSLQTNAAARNKAVAMVGGAVGAFLLLV